MHFNPKKCTVMHLSVRGNTPPHPYYLAGEELERVREHKYLGVTIADNLSWNSHIDNSCNKASQILGLLRRTLKKCSIHTKSIAYQALVRPHLEYATPAWDPHTKANIDKLEKVQRRAARFVLNNYTYPPAPNSSVTAMLASLEWQPLHTRRTVTRLTLFYRIVHETIAIPNHMLIPGYRRTRITHPYKYLHMQCRVNQLKYSFLPRTIIEWNDLPPPIVLLPSSDSFKLGVMSHLAGSPGYYYAHPAPN
jgi:hypothetical protein